jgi:hypothetical protein
MISIETLPAMFGKHTEINRFVNKNFWQELIAQFPLMRAGQHRKSHLTFFYIGMCAVIAAVTFFTELLPSNYTYMNLQIHGGGLNTDDSD